MEIYLFYDARPLLPWVRAYKCKVVKNLKTGFKIQNLDEPGEYEDVILKPDGTARGWNTITWLPTSNKRAEGDYIFLRQHKDE